LARIEAPQLGGLEGFGLAFSPDGTLLLGVSNDSFCVRVYDLRKIRQGLVELGLDWDAPPYPPAPPAGRLAPLTVEVVRDNLVNTTLTASDLKKELAKWEGTWEDEDGNKMTFKGDRWTSGTPTFGPVSGKIKVVEVRQELTLVDLLTEEGET